MIQHFLTQSEQEQTNAIAQLFDNKGTHAVCHLIESIAIHYSFHIKGVVEQKVVLASRSPRRKFLLDTLLKLTCVTQASASNELIPTPNYSISIITKTIAVMKLIAIIQSNQIKGTVILTSDTLIHVDNSTIIGKPSGQSHYELLADAKRILINLLGKRQIVSSSIVAYDLIKNKLYLAEDTTEIQFLETSPEILKLLDTYIALKEKGRGPLGKAGAYGIQDPEILSITRHIIGDPFVLVGLSLEKTYELLMLCSINMHPLSKNKTDLFEHIWGSEIWKTHHYTTLTKAPVDHNFVPILLSKL